MHGHTHQSKHKKKTGSKEVPIRQSGEEYATINCSKGNAQFDVTLNATNQSVIAKARGTLISGPKKQRLDKGDIVLLQQDECTSSGNKYYIIHKYTPEDIKGLRKAGELTQIKEVNEEDKIVVAFQDDVIIKKQEETVIGEDFIANL